MRVVERDRLVKREFMTEAMEDFEDRERKRVSLRKKVNSQFLMSIAIKLEKQK